MDAQKLVSVVVPIYNVEKYLRQCVDSVLAQTYGELEIILVDDGSTDGCGDICDEYAGKDRRIRVIHKPNGGLSDARNAGFLASTGEYVYFLDSDDYIVGTAIEELYRAAEESEADFVFFEAVCVYESAADHSKDRAERYIRKRVYGKDSGCRVLNKLIKHGEYRSAVPLTFIRVDFLRRHGLQFYKGILHEDELYTALLYLYAGRVVHLPRVLYCRRERADSIMTARKTARNFTGYDTVFREILRRYTDKGLDAEAKGALRGAMLHVFSAAVSVFHGLDAPERAKAASDYRTLMDTARSMGYFASRQVRLMCWSYRLYRLSLWAWGRLSGLKKLPGLIKRSLRTLRNEVRHRTLFRTLRKSENQRRVLLIGTPEHGNLGDHAIAMAELKLLRDFRPDLRVIEIPMSAYRQTSRKLFRYIRPEDIVAISGGGWLGTLWQRNEDTAREIIQNCPRNRILIFPQTVYYGADENGRTELRKAKTIYPCHEDLTFCLRDQASYDFVLKSGLVSRPENCVLAPDMVLYLNHSELAIAREEVLLCFRQDCEKQISDSVVQDCINFLNEKNIPFRRSSTNLHRNVGLAEREDAVLIKLREFASSRLVVTDRLHSMLFAAITGTPCIALDNLTGKVGGVYQWIKGLPYVRFAQTPEEALRLIPELIQMKNCHFANDGLVAVFGKLAQRI